MWQRVLKGLTRDCLLFDSWSFLKKALGADPSISVDFIWVFKTNTKGFFKAAIEGLTKDWPGRSYIVLRIKPIVSGEMPLLSIGYK